MISEASGMLKYLKISTGQIGDRFGSPDDEWVPVVVVVTDAGVVPVGDVSAAASSTVNRGAYGPPRPCGAAGGSPVRWA